MATYSRRRITGDFAASDVAATTTERGRLLEALIAYLFARCPGVRHFGNNQLNSAGSSEVDVCFWNDRVARSLDFWPQILVAECKNTAERIGSDAVRIFVSKLQQMYLTHGILVAANGITGDEVSLRAAHDLVRTSFLQHRIQILVLTRVELEALGNTTELIRLLQDKILRLTMQARTFEG